MKSKVLNMERNNLSLDARQATRIRFKYRATISNSRYLIAKYAPRIVAFKLTPMGNNIRDPKIDPSVPYYEMWVIRKEQRGYIFREVTHGMGINGPHKTVRKLVLSTVMYGDIIVALLQENELGSLDIPVVGGLVSG